MNDTESTTAGLPEPVDETAFPGGTTLSFNGLPAGQLILPGVLGYKPFLLVEARENDDEALEFAFQTGGGPYGPEQIVEWLEMLSAYITDDIVPLIKDGSYALTEGLAETAETLAEDGS